MTIQQVIRSAVVALASVGAVSLIMLAASGIRGSARYTFTAYACEWRLLSDATCYPDTGRPSIYDAISKEMAAEEEMERRLAPILAEQERIKLEKREWDKNRRAADLEIQRALIIGCERDKLARMQEGKDVTTLDCRKHSDLR